MYPSPSLRNRPLIAARGSGELFSSQRVQAEPGRQTVFDEFQAKNLTFSSNDLREFFYDDETSNWGTGWPSGNIHT